MSQTPDITCERCGHGQRDHATARPGDGRETPDGRLRIRDRCGVVGCDCWAFLINDDLSDVIEAWGPEAAKPTEPSPDDEPDIRTGRVYLADDER